MTRTEAEVEQELEDTLSVMKTANSANHQFLMGRVGGLKWWLSGKEREKTKEPIEKVLYPIIGKEWESEFLHVRCPVCGEEKFYRFIHANNQDWMCMNPDCEFYLEAEDGNPPIRRGRNQCAICWLPFAHGITIWRFGDDWKYVHPECAEGYPIEMIDHGD